MNFINNALIVENVFEHVFDQLHYIGWPDFGAPTTTDSIIVLAKAVRKIVAQRKQNNSKVLVHCSAGAGRTGTFIALYQFMEILDEMVPEYKRLQRISPRRPEDIEEMAIDIFNHVFILRKQRCELVKNV